MVLDEDMKWEPENIQKIEQHVAELYGGIDRLITEHKNKQKTEEKPPKPERLFLIPKDIRNSTFRLPSVDEKYFKFFVVDEEMRKALVGQLYWTPPGWSSSLMLKLHAIPNSVRGDCLFNAVAQGLWCVEDRNNILRKTCGELLKRRGDTLKEIFIGGKMKMMRRAMFKMDAVEMDLYWKRIFAITETPGMTADPFLLFILSNVLGRPIIMHGQIVRGDPISKIEMRGIYLPTLMDPEVCYKTPIVVGALSVNPRGHVSSLVGFERHQTHVSLFHVNGKRLPVWYGAEDNNEIVLLQRYMDVTWKEAYNGWKYPLAKMGKMTMNAGNDAMAQWAKRAIYLFEEAEREEEESTTDEESTDGSEAGGNTGACAKRKRECDGNDEGELSRPSKRTLPPSPSVSSDVVVEHVPDSGTRRMRVDLPRPAASAPAIAAASGPGVGSVTRVPDSGTRRMTMVLPRPAASAPAIAAASGPGVGSVTRVPDSGTRMMRVVLPRPAASAPAIAAAPPPPPPTLAIAAAPPPLARENPRLVRGRVATACVAAATFVVTAILFVRE